jgi:pimeloyl-ACP methyl ester carboxylesterase
MWNRQADMRQHTLAPKRPHHRTMKTSGVGLLLLGMQLLVCTADSRGRPERIACITGDTGIFLARAGAGSYPRELRRMLGGAYEVRTYRLRGMPAGPGSSPDRSTQPVNRTVDPAALKWLPEIVFMEPGIVDSAGGEGTAGNLPEDVLVAIVQTFKDIASKPRIMLLLPVPAPGGGTNADSLLLSGTIPRIRSVAYATGCEVVDLHSLFLSRDGYAAPQEQALPTAADMIATRLRDLLMIDAAAQCDIVARAGIAGTGSSYYGYECLDFRFSGREAKIVRPKTCAKGCPWIWRARFWGHEPQTEIALLERGFHVAYCDVAELYGNDEAIGIWDRFYDMLTGAGLAKKAVLEGFSRGGVYIYRWAVHSPSRVACIYADAPVLDLKSWPGGKGTGGGNPVEWQRFKDDFGLGSEEEALAFRGNPLDMAGEIARGGFPMLHICGLADVVVPIEENTDPFEKKILSSGGHITVIRKPGIGHHPHSLPNPQPIVDFILRATSGSK